MQTKSSLFHRLNVIFIPFRRDNLGPRGVGSVALRPIRPAHSSPQFILQDGVGGLKNQAPATIPRASCVTRSSFRSWVTVLPIVFSFSEISRVCLLVVGVDRSSSRSSPISERGRGALLPSCIPDFGTCGASPVHPVERASPGLLFREDEEPVTDVAIQQ